MDSAATMIAFAAAVFTGAQAYFQHRQTADQRQLAEEEATRRRKERYDDDVRRQRVQAADQDQAYLAIWAEHFRLDSLANQWEAVDLLERALLDLLDPKAVLPDDPARLVSSAARLGQEAGFLAATAATFASDTALQIAEFNSSVKSFTALYAQPLGVTYAEYLRQFEPVFFAEREPELKHGVRELANLWWDAANHSGAAHLDRTLRFRDDVVSEFGRAAIEALVKRGERKNGDAGGSG
jgi:hypothetical protein